MTIKEKMLLVQLILEDIRGNWATDTLERADFAISLCEELVAYNESFQILKEDIGYYIRSSARLGDWDGRYFRDTFPHGYEGMNSLHLLDRTYYDKSCEFQRLASDFLTHPEYRFNDWE